ncbi:Broad-complex core protein isoform 6,Protein tramtrack, alpha isoform,Protein bric-a-brac 1,Protein tramtrack, beta isoform,Longitudinals lacking protein-like,Broad-complex core protein isoforms 1/2/3/4/5,Protein abrupt,Protein bric-a-brac 2 [Lepeophtheirus salmonis]|uniref:Uncharacterized protein n=1 Tax=Lepeophtheirus salmonis TaxID=72036 RepID=A0A7R8CQG0_LEPSM|nr:Broad-complex core protein isoform 6,Protein tramtrack, alpha isoform,Protein bric-a-brac 1,Protein tramtrack, beta isoform,Longitudinals lacking protein-like,Broad-complex core protein isoforms 1/2/3/4/5,Protein abrupt,Protein bric-a-brac 2 [Lepeophtheirus salmonis]CAF2895272.1 Broad-complex core protein isoform 6,Protein tramtrack, alpha isoform,Protein bric-a-brac 1,Protein tramtrack, beta isoform,Longitudinals lacking protein-like,Broad-complex core protein isoforms 1/2/3/4/5,Protein abrupt
MYMGSTERLCLRWNDFESNIKHGFSELREEEEFFDVTLACGSKQIKAHKVILSACSPFFRSIIKSVPHQHPLLYLRGIKFNHLESLLCFMYNGEVNVTQEELNNFLAVAEELKIKGLTQNQSSHSPPSMNEGSHPPPRVPPLSSVQSSVGTPGGGSSTPRPRVPPPSQRPPPLPQPSNVFEDDDEIEDITPVKAEPKDTTGNTMVVTPDVSLGPDDLGDDAYTHEDENYEEYAQYGSESGEMSYNEGGSLMDPGLAAVPGPSGAPTAADGNKGLLEELEREIDTYVMDDTPGISSCRKCGYSTTVRSRLRRHIEARHYSCLECGHFSHQSSDLRKTYRVQTSALRNELPHLSTNFLYSSPMAATYENESSS